MNKNFKDFAVVDKQLFYKSFLLESSRGSLDVTHKYKSGIKCS